MISEPRTMPRGAARLARRLVGTMIVCGCGPAMGQTPPPGPIVAPQSNGSSLVQDPQQGATPRLSPPSPELPPRQQDVPVVLPSPPPSVAGPLLTPPLAAHGTISGKPDEGTPEIWTQTPGGLPIPSGDPMRIDPANDPVLQLARNQIPLPEFRSAIAAAVRHSPNLDEIIAQREEAQGVRNEAVARRAPVADLSLSSFKIISRAFSNDIDNILESSRPDHRTDGLAHVQVPVFDFGATGDRIVAGDRRIEAASANVEDMGTQLALRAIGAWYNVYGYRALVRLAEAFALSQRDLHVRVEQRVAQGVSALADVAQVDSYLASSDAQLAEFRRSLASAEAQYASLFGSAAPATLGRAPIPDRRATVPKTMEALPSVRSARLVAEATAREAKALTADRMPQLSASLDAGRYGVFETQKDYDVRGTVTLSVRLGGGAAQRVEQARARVNGADAHYRRMVDEATRDVQIAETDVAALEQSRAAIEANYVASRRSRDALAERFRVSRGTLLDLLAAQGNYFGVAARYIQTVIELDTTRYTLLARTGQLLPALDITPSALDPGARSSH